MQKARLLGLSEYVYNTFRSNKEAENEGIA